ncbi:MAG TPA: sensor histidine kinase [Chitinophagaceae bacterium]|nr:sensor histidine kinase [Chitinophagaceae bacterium]
MQFRHILLKYKLQHLFFWMLVCGIWFMLRVDDYPTPGKAFLVTVIKVFELALMIYITNLVLIPKLLYRKKYFLFTLTFVVMVLSGSIIKMSILGHYLNNPLLYNWSSTYLKDRIYDNILPHFFLVIAGVAVKLMLDYGKLQKRMVEIAKEKAEAELNFLKSQINPHFLFNSLNSVYFLINKDNHTARMALHKFSDMLRYQLYEMNGAKLPVEKEVAYLKDYVDMQKLRKDEKFSVDFDCSAGVKGFFIEPLLLIPFVENAFKYVSHHTDKENYIRLHLDRANGTFFFTAENSKESQLPLNEQGGIGLKNVSRRLELLYPGKHQLEIKETEDNFTVQLKLDLS